MRAGSTFRGVRARAPTGIRGGSKVPESIIAFVHIRAHERLRPFRIANEAMTKGKMKLGLSRLRSGLKAIMAARRGFVPAAGALILLLSGARAWAQYSPIPNYVGIGAGQQFRNDINNHLSGVTPMPAEQDGQPARILHIADGGGVGRRDQ